MNTKQRPGTPTVSRGFVMDICCGMEIKVAGGFNEIFCNHIVQRWAKRRGCLLSYSQAEPGRELTQPSPRLLAEPCSLFSDSVCERRERRLQISTAYDVDC